MAWDDMFANYNESQLNIVNQWVVAKVCGEYMPFKKISFEIKINFNFMTETFWKINFWSFQPKILVLLSM